MQRQRADFVFGLGWTALGLAISAGAWNMDRLENQGVEPYAVPGLLPGLLGLLLAGFGAVLALRGWRGRGPVLIETEESAFEPWRAGLALLLAVAFVVGALGHGPPFWACAFGFVFLAILLFELPERRQRGTVLRGAVQAAVIAAVVSVLVTLVFQEVFLVRLP